MELFNLVPGTTFDKLIFDADELCLEKSPTTLFDEKLYEFNDDLLTYSNALRICKENGGKMFEPKNELVYNNIVKISKEKALGNIWIGINDLSNEGNFVYNSDNSDVIWTYWSDSNPDDYKGKEDCVETEWKFGEGKWNDVSCNSLRAFVCEFDN